MVQDTHAILGKFYVPFSDLLNVVNSSMFGNCFRIRKMITLLRKIKFGATKKDNV